jgi:hypothetical protein
MKKAGALPAIAVAAGIAGCSALAPYPTYPRYPEADAHDKGPQGPRVAICYDPLVSRAARVQQAAQGECAADSVATRVDTDLLLQYCPVLLPARATFVCTPKTGK